MSPHDPNISMRQMMEHAQEAVQMAAGQERVDLEKDRKLELALTRLVEIVGEAAKRVPKQVQAKHPRLPWAQAMGYRDRLAHGYDSVDLAILWATVEEEFPPLIARLERILR